ncbi:2-polyprenyl-6-methoxyphenol hydroxylase-like FAD-dependent oxidoreductase [Spinactinospora alkalitolerans]|uniref:2-polyprenyl-6-methoxyphenol hydroxylase-like FAD-dependent oxidoreductase n=1 Tax=Spinactinospora alkalitolerans TaxID=687207 RepID=A0A852TP64_9ACTN|nr:hypothetical protein [Spinactinospora alkalitolerans]NYE45231.1 2-polyprenyl-6-methoxyphenol hydroxylase-like FAD-dependent oxidoreductase [Spinactinospora alkalitolerans]
MALAGAHALADELRGDGGVPAALGRYEARVRPVVQQRQAESRDTADTFVPAVS